jgi:septal ring factor EnvC (AmiA/AmiB activator)
MNLLRSLLAFVALAAILPSPARAADQRDPDWPCVQPKVPQMSIAAIWDGPSIADVGDSWQDDPKIRDLVARLAARRTPLDAAEKAIADFITGTTAEKQDKAKKLFAGLFDTLSEQRSEVMSGIDRTARKEKDLADKIRSDVTELHRLEDKSDQDQSKVNTLANQVQWSTRIFEDRRKTIRYVCEVPTIIEQRVFALGRAIRQALD